MPLLPLALAVALAAAPIVGVPVAIAPGCDITDATLSWGFKESFRAYIDSDIANGEWTTADGATYETPSFGWSGGQGRYDPATGDGYIAFTGSVRFTGHDGLLDTTIADPFVQLQGDSALLLLNVTGATMDGDMVDTAGVPFVALASVDVVGGDAVRTVDAETTLTDEGAIAFPNYPAGEAFDPVSISMTVGKTCATGYQGGDDISEPDDGFSPVLVGLLVLGVAVAAGAVGALVALTRRRRA